MGVKEKLEIHVLWNDYRNNLKLLQYKKFKRKETFGKIVKVGYHEETGKDGVKYSYYKVSNEYGDEVSLSTSTFCPSISGANMLVKKMCFLKSQIQGDHKVALFMTVLNQTKGFID